jgi:hypothetical protein
VRLQKRRRSSPMADGPRNRVGAVAGCALIGE